jgi:hypothetical protein
VAGSNRCVEARCERDADCIYTGQGRCGTVISLPMQAGDRRISSVECVYPMTDTFGYTTWITAGNVHVYL